MEVEINVVDFAYQIIGMHEKLLRLSAENESLRESQARYTQHLQEGIEHGEVMMGNLLQLALTPGVIEACRENNTVRKLRS